MYKAFYMKEIEQIYCNDFGVAFYWKKSGIALYDKVQVIFRETGFYLTYNEIAEFSYIINNINESTECSACEKINKNCKLLLKTPFEGLEMAVSQNELLDIKDLIEGALFKIRLKQYLSEAGRN